MSAIGKLARAPALTVYANQDGSLWTRVDGRRRPLHGGTQWIKREDGRRMRGTRPLAAAPSRAPHAWPPHGGGGGSEDEASGDDEYDEDLALALALSMADADAAGDPAPPALVEPPPAAAAPAAPPPAAASTPSCSICMEDIVAGGPAARAIACGHSFHSACLARWVRTNPSCPECRRPA